MPSAPLRFPPQQQGLPLEFSDEQVLEMAEQIRAGSRYWSRRYPSVQQLLQTEPGSARTLLICARNALRAKQSGSRRQHRPPRSRTPPPPDAP